MFSNPGQNFHQINPFFLQSQFVWIRTSQPKTFYQQISDPTQFQPSFGNNHIILNNLSQYHDTEQKRKFENCAEIEPLIPQREFRNVFLKSKKQNDNFFKKIKTNGSNSNFKIIDLSNIKKFPSQEKLNLEGLDESRRKNKRWTKEEDLLLFELKNNLKLSWKEIASHFPTRTLKACQFRLSRLKNVIQKYVKKKT